MWNDADIEQAALEELGSLIHHLRSKGICTHEGVTGRMGAAQLGYAIPRGFELMCNDCGAWFKGQGDWLDQRDEILEEYL